MLLDRYICKLEFAPPARSFDVLYTPRLVLQGVVLRFIYTLREE